MTDEEKYAKRSLMKREKSTGLRMDPCGTPRLTRNEVSFVIMKNHAKVPLRKERLSPTSKTKKETSEISLWKRVGCQTESKTVEKSIIARIVEEPSLGLLNAS